MNSVAKQCHTDLDQPSEIGRLSKQATQMKFVSRLPAILLETKQKAPINEQTFLKNGVN
jgi:hypothetical protein